LGSLRKTEAALQKGNIEFFRAGDGQIGFCRRYENSCLKIYVNRSGVKWEIPDRAVLLGENLQTDLSGGFSLVPMGFCVVKE